MIGAHRMKLSTKDLKENGKVIVFTIVKSIAILICAAFLGFFLLVLAYKIPVNPEKVASTRANWGQMGWSPHVAKRYENYTCYFDTFEVGVLDDGTDKIIIGYSLNNGNDSLVKRSAQMFGYGRYWHGYVTVVRPLFYFIDYWDFNLLNGMAQIAVALLLALLVWKETEKMRYPMAVLSSYLLLMPVALAASLQFSPVFYVSFLGSIAVVLAKDYLCKRDRLILFFLGMGIIVCYYDFLTYPLLAWAFPLCWYLVVSKDSTEGRRLFDVITTAISWTFGYVGMFLMKWIILYAVCGSEIYEECNTSGRAASLISALTGDLCVVKQTYTRFGTLFTNWRHYMYLGFIAILLAWLLWAVYNKFRFNWRVRRETIPFLLIMFASPAWYYVFASHTAIHHFFTYRTYGASILAMMLFLSGCVDTTERNRDFKKWNWKAMIALGICICIGFASTLLAKMNVNVLNGGMYQNLHIVPGDVFETDFYASFGEIKEFGVCALEEGMSEGTLRYKIFDEDLLYEVEFPVEEFCAKTYSTQYVDWFFEPGKPYRMEVTVEGNPEGIDLLVTEPGNMPLSEYRNSSMNQEALGEIQLLGGMIYKTIVVSRREKLILSFLVGCFLFMLGEGLVNQFDFNEFFEKNKKI